LKGARNAFNRTCGNAQQKFEEHVSNMLPLKWNYRFILPCISYILIKIATKYRTPGHLFAVFDEIALASIHKITISEANIEYA